MLESIKNQFDKVLSEHKLQYSQKNGRILNIDKLCNVMFLSGLVLGQYPDMLLSYVMQKVDLVIEDDSTSAKEKLKFLYNTLPLKVQNDEKTVVEEKKASLQEKKKLPIVIPKLDLSKIDMPYCYQHNDG